MPVDYTAVGLQLCFWVGMVFTIIGFESEFWRNVVYHMFAFLGWLGATFLFLGSGSDWVSIPWLFFFLALMNMVAVLLRSLQSWQLKQKVKRGYA